MPHDPEEVTVVYTNYRGETSARRIRPRRIAFSSTEWHPEPQWLLEAFDYSRNDDRSFALKDVMTWRGSSEGIAVEGADREVAEEVTVGAVFEHFKGERYEVMGVGTHSETEEPMVFYRKLYGDFSHWMRPLAMFRDIVELNGERVPRFRRVG